MRRPPRRLALLLALVTVGTLAATAAATTPDATRRGGSPGTTAAVGATHLVVGRAVAPMGLLSGPDVSDNNVNTKADAIQWGAVAGSGRSFAIVKATEGARYTNEYFKHDWSGAKANGIIRAAYHFARPMLPISTAVTQATRFAKTVGKITDGVSLPLVLDLEQSGGLSVAHMQQWTSLFLQTAEKLSGRTPIVYTYTYFWQHYLGNSSAFTRYPLWIASYTSKPPHPLPGGWRSWTLWQFTDRGHVPGVRGGVDLSVFCCTAGALASLANPIDAIGERYAALGGITGSLGAPVGAERSVGTGLVRDYAHGSIYETKTDGAHVLTGPTRARYRALGGPLSILGWPQTDSLSDEAGPAGATYAVFDFGRLYGAPHARSSFLLPNGPLLTGWLQRGSIRGLLGLPTSEVTSIFGGTMMTFAGGDLFSSPARGVHELHGDVLVTWLAAGGVYSQYGLPSSDVLTVPGGTEAVFGDLTIFAPTPGGPTAAPTDPPSPTDPASPVPTPTDGSSPTAIDTTTATPSAVASP